MLFLVVMWFKKKEKVNYWKEESINAPTYFSGEDVGLAMGMALLITCHLFSMSNLKSRHMCILFSTV